MDRTRLLKRARRGGDAGFALLFSTLFGKVELRVSEVHGAAPSMAATAAARRCSQATSEVRSALQPDVTSLAVNSRSGTPTGSAQGCRAL
ncbi:MULTISPECIES: hypothetical protein [unclassified Ensifer]|uniref:hypothetical protein n=1 Tax=unclassified Ensifer TaxID=2633371 RepID=UPI000812F81E|nr:MULTISPECIES: hypothetical protein [unclassified Ensifer]OCP17451.1 hypothetical protein BC361_08315 [Ensifer sp. LC54]OCP28643.1 hypothetical protein BC363_02040 [Ensifer sp. LC384]